MASRKLSVWVPYFGAGASHFFGSIEEVKQELLCRNPNAAQEIVSRINELTTVPDTDYRRMDLYTGEPNVHALPSVQFLPPDYPERRATPDGRMYRLIKPGTIQYCDNNEISVSF